MRFDVKKFNVGLTGGIGSGKSLVASFFAELGIQIIDADIITRELMLPGETAYRDIVAHFGKDVLLSDKCLNRQYLRELVFANDTERKWLEKLLHPKVRASMIEQASKSPSAYNILVIPLLIETLPNPLLDRILTVTTQLKTRIQRIIDRDHCNEELAKNIIGSQANDDTRHSYSDDTLLNNDDKQHLKQQVLALHQKYLQLAQ